MDNSVPLKIAALARPIIFDTYSGLSGRYTMCFVTPDALRENDRVVGKVYGGIDTAPMGYYVISTDTARA